MTATKAVNGLKLGRPTDLYGPLWRLAVKIRAAWLGRDFAVLLDMNGG
jgi:hypothetical protein